MDPEELELHNDYRYRSYAAVIDKALRNFESSSEWADLISNLGKLNKALQSNLKYSLLPKRLIIGKRLAQCLHPALPSGVHLKALETYEIVFKIIGTKWLAKDLFIYSSGLFPLLGHAAMSVKPALLTLYERYYLPLQRALLPSLQAFITGLLPGLEEGLEVYDRTDALLVKLAALVGQQVFYGSLWGSMLISPTVRLSATHFIVTHFDRMATGRQQSYMLGSDQTLVIKSIRLSLQDSNLLVQRNMLEILLYFFPFCTCEDAAESSIPMSHDDVIMIVSSASLTLLRRDMSLNRRLYAWLQGTDSKGSMVAPDPTASSSLEEHMLFYFEKYSRDLLLEALVSILKHPDVSADPDNPVCFLKPFRILISLLDKPEIGPRLTGELMLEVVRSLYTHIKELLGEEIMSANGLAGNQLSSKIKENKSASEIVKTANMLIGSLNSDYLWDYMTRCFQASLGLGTSPAKGATATISELSSLIMFLLDVVPLELYSEIQTQYIPQMLSSMLEALSTQMGSLGLTDVRQALRACFKLLSRVQMPMADMEAQHETVKDEQRTQSPDVGKENHIAVVDGVEDVEPKEAEMNVEVGQEVDHEDVPIPSVHSEDSGLGLSTSTSEQILTQNKPETGLGVWPGRDDVWRKGGCVETMSLYMQQILALFITRYLLGAVDEKKQEGNAQANDNVSSLLKKKPPGPRGSRELGQFKEKLTEFFTPTKQKFLQLADFGKEKSSVGTVLKWAEGFQSRDKSELPEPCRLAFSNICRLLLECSTFPIYLLEEEMESLYRAMFYSTAGSEKHGLPVWLRFLMILSCGAKDSHIQHMAISAVLELVNHSQSLALVIQDKKQRYKNSDSNPFSGRLQMVNVPLVYPVLLKVIEEDTDFYQRVAQVLWSQLDSERRELHVSCVDLFFRLHCLAPSASVCEDVVCVSLQHHKKAVQLEALHRFSVLWHLSRDIQSNRTLALNRSFDRSLFVVLDSLTSPDGSVSAATHIWLVRALSLGDVARILEPVLLLLLHPQTQRSSIHKVRENMTAGHLWRYEGDTMFSNCTMTIEESRVTVVDREALWSELEHVPDTVKISECSREESDRCGEEEEEDYHHPSEEDSEHTESADTSEPHVSTEAWSSGSTECSNAVRRVDSQTTQTSESLSSEEEGEEEELCALARARLLKQELERRQAADALHEHTLLYTQAYDSPRVLYAFSLLERLLRVSAQPFVEALSTPTSSTLLSLVNNLLQRHQEALEGRSFYGRAPDSSADSLNPPLLLEILSSLCLRFLRSHYPRYLRVSATTALGNREVQVKSVQVLTRLARQLVTHAQEGGNVQLARRLLSSCHTQRYVLLSLLASMHVTQRPELPQEHQALSEERLPQEHQALSEERLPQEHQALSEERLPQEHQALSEERLPQEHQALSEERLPQEHKALSEERLIDFGHEAGWSEQPLQVELLKLLQELIVLEHHVGPEQSTSPSGSSSLARDWQTAVEFQQSIRSAQYVPSSPITAQGMFICAASRGLQPGYGYTMHPPWVALICAILPYLGRSLAFTSSPAITQICKNLDDLVRQHDHETSRTSHSSSVCRRENIAPDYPLTLLEGLTAVTHYCLLENRKVEQTWPVWGEQLFSATSDPADMRNARNAVVEELPRVLSTLALLWGVVGRDEWSSELRRSSSTSVYFSSTKILKQKILDFLNPMMGPYGVQVMASVGAVWSNRRNKRRHNKNKILPVATESHLTLLDLVKSLNTLRTESILHLLKEVVKKPHLLRGDQKSTLVDIPLLHFSFAFIQGLPPQKLQENITPLLCLLKESVQLNLAPPGHFLLLGILNDLVNRLPNLDNKKDMKDLQEVTQRVLEAVGSVAGSSLEQTSWLSRSLEVKAQPQVCVQEEDEPEDMELYDSAANAMVSSSAPSVYSVQALSLLAEVLAPLLDMVYRSDEKEKAVPLISRLMYYVFPYLKNHSAYNIPSFCAGAQLLSSLSGYAYTRRAWKKEAFDLFMDPLFFHMDTSCTIHWRSIIDHLLTQEKTMFKDLMSMQSSSLKVFSNQEPKALLLRRQAFAVFSGELDQYHLYLPIIQERLTENLRLGQTPSVAAQMFLIFRVLILRISPQHLTSLWPIMVTELIHTFVKLEKSLLEDRAAKSARGRGGSVRNVSAEDFTQSELDMYLSACKFLDTALSFPPDRMPLFQMYRWAFVPEVNSDADNEPETPECKPHVVRILQGLHKKFGELNGTGGGVDLQCPSFPLLTVRSISSITQLGPFLQVLTCSFRGPVGPQPVAEYPTTHTDTVLNTLENIIQHELLERVEN